MLVWFCFTSGVLAAPPAKPKVLASAAKRFASRKTKATPDFQKHVVPLLGKLGCNSAKCHGSFQGQGGFRLSLFGFDFAADLRALHAKASSNEGARINLRAAEKSLIVAKPTAQIDHEGGERFKRNSWEHHLLLRWIESGAKGADEKPTKQTIKPNPRLAKGVRLFKQTIQPLLENNCYECHGFDERKGQLQVKSRALLIQGGKSGAAIVPGKPERSLLMKAVRHTTKLMMPPSGKLKPKEISALKQWIKLGAPWPKVDKGGSQQARHLLAKLHYEPSELLFEKAGQQTQIRIIAEWQSGQREDVTCLTRFRSNNNGIVSVNQDGMAVSTGRGDTHIVAFYDNGVVAIPVLRPVTSTPRIAAKNRVTNPIDRFVNRKLAKLGIQPSKSATDAEFLRRLSIDMTGSLPTPQEVETFLKDKTKGKRLKKINELLDRSTYAAWWSNKICDFTGCSPASIRSLLEVAREEGYVKASQWYDWVYARVARNEPYDKLVAGIMLADISNVRRGKFDRRQFRSGGGALSQGMPHFWDRQSLKEPKDVAMSVAHAFLGIQLQCAECHKHPFDQWTQSDFRQFASFFSFAGDEPQRGKRQLRLLRSEVVDLQDGQDPRKPIMDWMRRKQNPWFARAFVNRVWAGYFHVGIVDPPDQFTPANPASNPELLNWLTREFIRHKYDMKWLHRQITSSQTYQRSWRPNATNRNDHRNFSRAIPRRIPAEVVYDAMKQATAATGKLDSVRTNLKRRASGHLSMRMAGTHALRIFGKPNRSINCDCERVNQPTLLQAIFLQNDPLVRYRLTSSGWLKELEGVGKQKNVTGRLIRQVYLRTVNRPPTARETARCQQHLESVDSISEGIRDLMWVMLNTKEFLLNH